MRFLSNFGCRIIFMCSVNFLKEALVTWPLSASGRPLYRVWPLRTSIFKKEIIFCSCWRWVSRVIPKKRYPYCFKEKFYVHKCPCQCVSLRECDVKRVCELGLIFEVSALNMAATDFVSSLNMVREDPGRPHLYEIYWRNPPPPDFYMHCLLYKQCA